MSRESALIHLGQSYGLLRNDVLQYLRVVDSDPPYHLMEATAKAAMLEELLQNIRDAMDHVLEMEKLAGPP